MCGKTPIKLNLLQSLETFILILFGLTSSCSCLRNNSSVVPETRDLATNDNQLIIILFSVTCGLLLAIVLFCILKWCFKRYCSCRNQSQNSSGNACVTHSHTDQVFCERHCQQCVAERLGHYPLSNYHGGVASYVPQPAQPATVESQTNSNIPQPRDTSNTASTPHTASIPQTASIPHTPQKTRSAVSPQTSNASDGCADSQLNLNDDILAKLSINDLGIFNQLEGTLQELLIPTTQSVVKTVAGKSLVYITHVVDSNGDVLTLDNMGVSLHIPRNAVPVGKKQPITLALSWDLSDAPSLDSSQAHVSPVIYCGPHGLKLEKPCILSYKHCAYDPKNVSIMVSETEITEDKKWESLCFAQEDGGKCVVTLDECHVRLNHFSLLTSTQISVEGNAGKKWLQVAVFASALDPAINHYQIRVYFFNKTPCNLQWAIYNEAQFGGKLVCPEKTVLFSGGGEDMQLKLHYLSKCWIPVDDTGSDKVSFLQIWHNQCPHASMCFKRSERHKATPSCKGPMDEINIQFLLFQTNHENEAEKIIIHMAKDRIFEDISELKSTKHVFESVNIHIGPSSKSSRDSPIVRVRHTADKPNDIRVDVDNETDVVDLDEIQQSLSERQTIPVILKHQLVLMLDPLCPFHHDWRELAARLGLDKVIPYLEGKYSPTSIILQHLENKGKTLLELYNILKEMEREDAASFVEKYLLNSQRVATEGDAF